MKYLLSLFLLCSFSFAAAQPVATLKSDDAEINSGTIDRDELLSMKELVVADAENPEKKYEVISFVLIYQGPTGMYRQKFEGNDVQKALAEINQAEEQPISPGDQIVFTMIEVKDTREEDADPRQLETGLVLQVR